MNNVDFLKKNFHRRLMETDKFEIKINIRKEELKELQKYFSIRRRLGMKFEVERKQRHGN